MVTLACFDKHLYDEQTIGLGNSFRTLKGVNLTMSKTYFLQEPYVPAELNDLALPFISQQSSINKAFAEAFVLIMDHVQQFEIKDDEIKNLRPYKGDLVYTINVKNMFGQYRESIIIKKLRKFHHTYEARINQEYYKHRILFHFISSEEGVVERENFFILSYGFSKEEGNSDLTDQLATSNDLIKKDILNGENNINKWLGDDWIEYS